MSSVNLLIPKNKYQTFQKQSRPVYIPALEPVEITEVHMVEVPLLGWVSAGQPIDMLESNENVAVPANMVRRNTYALRVRGDSMIDDNIQDGDVIVIEKRESASNGETVVAMINYEQVTLKKLYIELDGIRLQPANPEMEPIYLHNADVQILGIVTGVIRTPE